MKTVLIVAQGSWGRLRPEDEHYKEWINFCKFALEEAEKEVRVVDTVEEVEKALEEGKVSNVMFISRGMIEIAEMLAKTYPGVKIIVFTSLPFDLEEQGEKVEIVDKAKMDLQSISKLLF